MARKWKKVPWSEQTRLIATSGLCVILLVVAAVLPLAFRRTPDNRPANESDTRNLLEAKASLFVDYWYDGGAPVEVEKLEHPNSRTVSFCRARMDELVDAGIDDRGLDERVPTGSEYTVISRGDTKLHLCRMWLQARGDWQNWIDVCFDAETGEVYYFYLSRECLTNGRLYTVEKPSVEDVANRLAAAWNGRIRYTQPDGGGKGTALLSTEDGTIGFEISCISYDALIDIRISCI